jgi:hypothetical protein
VLEQVFLEDSVNGAVREGKPPAQVPGEVDTRGAERQVDVDPVIFSVPAASEMESERLPSREQRGTSSSPRARSLRRDDADERVKAIRQELLHSAPEPGIGDPVWAFPLANVHIQRARGIGHVLVHRSREKMNHCESM